MSRAEGRQAQDGSGACRQALTGQALVHGYDTAFWWTAGIFAGGAVIGATLLPRGPLVRKGTPSQVRGEVPATQARPLP